MEHASPFAAWESFYVIVGSSAAALTGLQFVVMTLIATEDQARSEPEVRASGTPTVVHFCAVLLVAVILSAPWHALSSAALALDACGLAGVAYVGIVIRRTRARMQYRPVLEDWIWHVAIPLLAYSAILFAALILRRDPAPCLFVIGAASVLLLFVGIHNAWDTVTYVALERVRKRESGRS